MIFKDKEILELLQSIDKKLNKIISSMKSEKLKSAIKKQQDGGKDVQ